MLVWVVPVVLAAWAVWVSRPAMVELITLDFAGAPFFVPS
jgi:hypothetical protein